MKLRQLCFVLPFCALFMGRCGGPTPEAKVANAILTLMTNVVVGYARLGADEGASDSVEIACGTGDEKDGSFTFSIPPALRDPSKLLEQLIADPDAGIGINVDFSACRLLTCGEELILDQGDAFIDMGLSASDLVSGDKIPAAFTLKVENQSADGILSGVIDYAYTIEAAYSAGENAAIEGIQIKSANPAKPIEVNGTILEASKIIDLADGC